MRVRARVLFCAAADGRGRLEVENAEDDLVQKTEVAITLMKTVLENVRRGPASPRVCCSVTGVCACSRSRSRT